MTNTLSVNLDHDVAGWTMHVQSRSVDMMRDYANAQDAVDAALLLIGAYYDGPTIVHILGGDVVVYATMGNA